MWLKNKSNKKINLDFEKIEEINEIKIWQKIYDISTGEDYSFIVS